MAIILTLLLFCTQTVSAQILMSPWDKKHLFLSNCTVITVACSPRRGAMRRWLPPAESVRRGRARAGGGGRRRHRARPRQYPLLLGAHTCAAPAVHLHVALRTCLAGGVRLAGRHVA